MYSNACIKRTTGFHTSLLSIIMPRVTILLVFTLIIAILSVTCSGSVKVDTSKGDFKKRLSTTELLEKHGLDEVADQFAEFIQMFDIGTHFFSKLNDNEQFYVLNLLVDAFKQSYLLTIEEVNNAKDKPHGPITFQMMKDLLERQEMHLKRLLKKDSRILNSEWAQFFDKIHMVFDGLRTLYSMSVENELVLQWWMLLSTSSFVKMIPSDLFDKSVFGELLHMPLALKDSIHEILEHIMQSDYASLIKLTSNMAAKYDWNKLLGGYEEHEEL